jgi:hypothetical protein
MESRQQQLTLQENFERLQLSEWAEENLSDEQFQRLEQLLDEAGGCSNITQARFLFELTCLAQPQDRELAHVLAERALESAEDENAWLEGDPTGIASKYWGYEAFLESMPHLRTGSDEERTRFYRVAEEQVALGNEFADRLRQYGIGPADYHKHSGYYYLAERAREEGDIDKALSLLDQAAREGWSGGWDQIRIEYTT